MPFLFPTKKISVSSIGEDTVNECFWEDVVDKMMRVSWVFNGVFSSSETTTIKNLKKEVGTELVNKQGKILKRLKKVLKAKRLVYEDRAQRIGNLSAGYYKQYFTNNPFEKDFENLRRRLDIYVQPMSDLQITFTDKFDWKEGEFGDSGSCFFNDEDGRGFTRKLLEYNNFRAIKLFTKVDKPFARALILPETLITPRKRGWFVFNAYGITLSLVAQILKKYWNTPYVKIYPDTDYDDNGMDIYFNNEAYLFSNSTEFDTDDNVEVYHKKLPKRLIPTWFNKEDY